MNSQQTIPNILGPASNRFKNPATLWQLKHSICRLLYSTNKREIIALWKQINGNKQLRPSIWREFVENPKLWEIIYDKLFNKVSALSSVTLDILAYSELVEEGMEALAGGEIYFLMPLNQAGIVVTENETLEKLEVEGRKKYTCQQTMKTILIYLLADLYKKDFVVYFHSHESMEINQDTIHKPFFNNNNKTTD
jgi:hypothetical protein